MNRSADRGKGRMDACSAIVTRAVLLPVLFVATLLSACDGSGRARAAVPSVASTASVVTAAGPTVVAVARGVVEVPGGLLEMMSPQDGVVDSVAVEEGASVKRGELLLRLSSEPVRLDMALAQAELQLARARQLAQQERLPGARQLSQRMTEAARAEVVDAQRADEAQQALRDLEAGSRVAEAETAVAARKLSQAQGLSQRLSLLAPHDARVVRLQVQPGAHVSAQGGRPLLVLLPDKALRVRAEVNESFLPRIVIGMRASVVLDGEAPGAARTALPAARVVRLSPVFGSGRLDDEAQARGNVRVVDCFLEFDRAPALRVGQAVRVDFHE